MQLLQYRELVTVAIKEDLTYGDITTDSIFTTEEGRAILLAKEEGIVAGLAVASEAFLQIGHVVFTAQVLDGSRVLPGQPIAVCEGLVASLLKGERTALNFLQRMSGIATITGKAVEEVAGTKAQIVDTRKTTPSMRVLEKYAVRMGGGGNHRFSLSDMVMIKDNHITGAGSITAAVNKVSQNKGFAVKIEVEAATLADVEEALSCGVDVIMLDNMSCEVMRQAVSLASGHALLEASGNMTPGQLRQVAETGVDLISLGCLTHSYKAFDISLKLELSTS